MQPQPNRQFIRMFNEINAKDVNLVGGKGANLGEMTGAGLPVPPGYCLTADAYRTFVHSAAHKSIQQILRELRIDDPEDVEHKTERIRTLLHSQPIPDDIRQQTLECYHRLNQDLGLMDEAPVPVAVRSSATAEDLPTASFAGQQDTYLNIRGDDQLLDHVRRCWASLWTARAVTYRVKQGFEHEKVALAVVVQAMVESEVSGIMFTANPVNSNREQIVINASWGLGEAIVSGMVTPDTIIVSKGDNAILDRDIASKELLIEYSAEGGTIEKSVAPDMRNIPALTDDQICTLADIGKRIEEHYQRPMDVEWGFTRGRYYVLQARPITTLIDKPVLPPTGVYDRHMFLEIFPEPLSPIFLSVIDKLFQTMLDYTFKTLGFVIPRGVDAICIFFNQPYFHTEYITRALKPLHSPFRERLASQIVQPFGSHTAGLGSDFSFAYFNMIARLFQFMVTFPDRLPGIISGYHQEVARIAGLRIEKMSDSEIVVHIRELVFGTLSKLLNYDFFMILLVKETNQLLGGWLERYFGKEHDEIRSRLVSGVTGNVTMRTNLRIWDLAQVAKSSPTVRAAMRAGGPDLRARLEETKEGRSFLDELDRFLKEFGHREVRMDITHPTWIEDPAPILGFVRGYLDVPESQSPYRQQELLVKQRQETTQKVKERIQRDPLSRILIWPIFNAVLKLTQVHTRERDTMHFEFTRVFPPFRGFIIELGRRWTAKDIVSEPDDLFYLRLDEIEKLAQVPQPMQEVVAKRKAELEYSRSHAAPARIQDGQAVVSGAAASEQSTEGQLRGIAGSPGVVRGIARVIRGPEEFDRLQHGEILVAPLTNPVWTPLFAIASGLITEVGGILSHGAIVAREYGIPAVMAVHDASHTLHDGQPLTVDGNKGVVYLE